MGSTSAQRALARLALPAVATTGQFLLYCRAMCSAADTEANLTEQPDLSELLVD
jgi:hypothetical protein